MQEKKVRLYQEKNEEGKLRQIIMVRGEKLNQNDMREYEEKQNCNRLRGQMEKLNWDEQSENQIGQVKIQKVKK